MLVVTYAVMAVISVILAACYGVLVKNKNVWLFCLFICVSVVNTGYFMLSVAKSLEFAIFANDFAYLGSVFLSMCMLLNIIELCGFKVGKKLVAVLVSVSVAMFLLIATSGFLPWYYAELSLETVEGATRLVKTYGVLHPLYMLYLLAYFVSMVVCIVRSLHKKVQASQRYASFVAVVVFGNIAVWLIQKFIPSDFEFLSVSYIFSELIFLSLHWMLQGYVRSDLVPVREQESPGPISVDISTMTTEEKVLKILSRLSPEDVLATREREILELILQNKKRKDIAALLCLSENTIKTYTRTLYGKLGVSSRDELFALLVK